MLNEKMRKAPVRAEEELERIVEQRKLKEKRKKKTDAGSKVIRLSEKYYKLL